MPSPERFNSLPSHSLRICSVSSRISTPSSERRSKAYSRTSSLHLPLCRPRGSGRYWTSSLVSFASDHTPKSDMTGGCVDCLGVACRRTITPAVIWGAEMRAAFDNLPRNFDVGQAGIVAVDLSAAARIFRNAAGFWGIGLVLLRVPVRGPFPDVADHVVNAVAVWPKRRDR